MSQQSSDKLPISCIVGIGTSAGGVNALKEFFSLLEGHRLSFVVIQHMDVSAKLVALEVLAHATRLPVKEISDGVSIEAGTVYVAQPHTLVTIEAGVFQVQATEGNDQRRSTIDHFFSSLAEDQKRNAIGIILSGEGSDGTEGLKAIGDGGGMTIAQSLDSAEFRSMPESAINSGAVDHVLPIAMMAEEIASYEKYVMRLLDQTQITLMRDQIGAALVGICDILFRATGHDFKHYKTNTLVRRIQRRMQILQMNYVESYVERLQEKSEEIDALFKELLINVTSFFRDPLAFEELRVSVLEKALAKQPLNHKYRIWVAGCSTGEEAYTLAIIIREILDSLKNPPDVQIIATDIDEIALNAARRGSFSTSIAEDVSPERLKRFFMRKGGRYIVSKELREMCLFSSHNLINDPPFSQLDLLTCRNVLIYLGPHLQQKLIPVFHYALKANGHLFLGTSESLTGHQELFRTLSAKYRIAQRRTTAIRSSVHFGAMLHQSAQRASEPMHSHEVDLNLIGQRIILDEFSPKYAIVNDEGQILSVSAGVHRYFEPSEGAFHNNILKLVNPGLRTALRSTFKLAKEVKRKVTNESSAVEFEGEFQRVGLVVQPMPQLGEGFSLFMVIFLYLGQIPKSESFAQSGEAPGASLAAVEQLERELTMMREDLDKTVQDLEASNEELKSSNEELLSMNEELQSANEELETSKEDVQAANEALIRSNSDLENLLAGTEIATVFLDDHHRIKSFTPEMSRFYRILPTDIGREIGDFTTKALYMPPYPPRREIEQLGSVEAEISMENGQTYLRRIIPYKTHQGRHEGLVVTFVDISELRQSEGRFHNLANMVTAITWMATDVGKVFFFNKRWYEYTGQLVDEAAPREISSFIHPEDLDTIMDAWQSAMEKGESFRAEFRLRRHDGVYRWHQSQGEPSRDRDGKTMQWFGTIIDINNQKTEVDLLKESGDGLRTIVETIPQYIWRTNADGAADYCSESFVDFVGRSREAILGWGWTEFIHPDDIERVRQDWTRARELEQRINIEFRIIIGGQERWVRSEGKPYFNNLGVLTKYYGTWNDIHDQILNLQRVEQNRRLAEASEAEVLENLESMGDGFFSIDKNFIITRVNSRFETILQTTRSDILGASVWDKFPAAAQPDSKYWQEYNRCMKERVASRFVEFYAPLDLWTAVSCYPKNDGGIAVFFQDVSVENQARMALLESEANFRLLADAMPQIVFTADVAGNINYFNSRWTDYTGYSFEETKEWGWKPVLHPDDLQRTIDRWLLSIRTGVDYEIEYRIKRGSDGEFRWHLGRAMRIQESPDRVTRWFGTNTDIHDVKLLTEELLSAKQSAESANQIKSRFLANMSHEIRTPLGVIIGFTDLLREQQEGGRDASIYIERIATNAQQLGNLIDEILDLSKIEADRLEADRSVVDLRHLLDDVLGNMGMMAREKGLTFEEKWVTPATQHILTDHTRLRQILINVIGNAIKFTDAGKVSVELGVKDFQNGRCLEIRVQDTGIGMTEEQMNRIFQPFMQADSSVTRRYGGTGLGLVLSQRLARVLGGDLLLEASTPGRGSTFILKIDIGDDRQPQLPGRTPSAKSPEAYPKLDASRSILIVDDSPDNRAIVSRFLKLAGAQIDIAENGAVAVEKALTGAFDLILMDIQMPVLDGYQALKQLREARYDRPIIALTAHAMKEEKDRCLQAGFTDYLSKPVDRRSLLQLIRDLLEGT